MKNEKMIRYAKNEHLRCYNSYIHQTAAQCAPYHPVRQRSQTGFQQNEVQQNACF